MYLLVCFTGGTIDITVHEVTSSGGLKEVHVDWLDLWRMFETKKKTVDPGKNDKVTRKLPTTLMELCKEETKKDIRDMVAESEYRDMIHFAGGDKVRFQAALIQSLFSESIDKTVTHVKSVLRDEKARDVKVILMVGGFSDSPMLQVAIKRAFPRLKIIIPKEASSAIMRGAVIFGHNPTSITQRVLKKTYGVECVNPFDEAVHDENYKEQTDSGVMCTKIFVKHVEKGQSVKVGEALAEQWGSPTDHNQEAVDISIYASDLKDPKYTDRGCQHLGTLRVDISDVPGDLDRASVLALETPKSRPRLELKRLDKFVRQILTSLDNQNVTKLMVTPGYVMNFDICTTDLHQDHAEHNSAVFTMLSRNKQILTIDSCNVCI